MNNYSITLVEVDEVLHHLSSQNFNKIPKDLINMISENKDKNYKWYYNENLSLRQQNLSRDAIVILSWINMEYLLDSEQKFFLKRVHIKNEKIAEDRKIEKYNTNDIFKKEKREKMNMSKKEISTELAKVENKNFIQKLINNIKKLFNKVDNK